MGRPRWRWRYAGLARFRDRRMWMLGIAWRTEVDLGLKEPTVTLVLSLVVPTRRWALAWRRENRS